MTDVGGPAVNLEVEVGHPMNVHPFAGFWSSEFGGHLVHEAGGQLPLGQTNSYFLPTHRQPAANGAFVASNGIYPVSGLFRMGIDRAGKIDGRLILIVAGEVAREAFLSGTLVFDRAFSKAERLWGSAILSAQTAETVFPLDLKVMAVSNDFLAWTSIRPSDDKNPLSILVAAGSLQRCAGIPRRRHQQAIAKGGRRS